MDYGKSFTYVFEDEAWITKFLIGVVVAAIPIINFASYGYVLEIVRRVRDGSPDPLPEWDEFGDLFIDGAKFVLGSLVYFLPVILLSIMILPVAIIGGEDPGAFVSMIMSLFACLTFIFSFVPMLILPALVVQYVKRDEIKDLFAFSDIWDMIRADLGTYIIILLFGLVVLSFVSGIGFIACGIGVFLTSWYAYLVGGHIMGQYAAQLPSPEKAT